jgi:hypothetical protein
LVFIAGASLAAVAFVVRLLRGTSFRDGYHAMRADLGRAILLALEFLVIAAKSWGPGGDRCHPNAAELRARAGSKRTFALAKATEVRRQLTCIKVPRRSTRFPLFDMENFMSQSTASRHPTSESHEVAEPGYRSADERRADGKALREVVTREAQGQWTPRQKST